MMYLINVTLNGQESEYANLIQAIKTLGPWSNRLMNTFLVECTLSAVQIRDLLKPHVKPGDRLFVGEVTRNWAATNMGADFPDWVRRRRFRELPAASAGPDVPASEQ